MEVEWSCRVSLVALLAFSPTRQFDSAFGGGKHESGLPDGQTVIVIDRKDLHRRVKFGYRVSEILGVVGHYDPLVDSESRTHLICFGDISS